MRHNKWVPDYFNAKLFLRYQPGSEETVWMYPLQAILLQDLLTGMTEELLMATLSSLTQILVCLPCSVKPCSDEGQLPIVQILLPYHTKHRSDITSTEMKETDLVTNNSTRCGCVPVPTQFTGHRLADEFMSTLGAFARQALHVDWHVLPSCV